MEHIFLKYIYCMCLNLYIHSTHTYYVYKTKTFIFDAINRLTALIYIYIEICDPGAQKQS